MLQPTSHGVPCSNRFLKTTCWPRESYSATHGKHVRVAVHHQQGARHDSFHHIKVTLAPVTEMEHVLFFFIVGSCFDFHDFHLKSATGFSLLETGATAAAEAAGAIFAVTPGI
uniref:Uncharacterized protein n=1 Tax=Physcomitrium patens TaxID=3218 RepID=A0A2K1JXA9_PHYPA|nr:hypothetical protein PHYPA_013277 [Physcomitrium patens]